MRIIKYRTQPETFKQILTTKTWFSVFVDVAYNDITIYAHENGLENREFMKLCDESPDLYQYVEMSEDTINTLYTDNEDLNLSMVF